VVGCEYHADGIGGPAETHHWHALGGAAALGAIVWGYTMDVSNVTSMRDAELNKGVRNLAR
jgi:hypothetical protein